MTTATKNHGLAIENYSSWSLLLLRVLKKIEYGELLLITPEGDRLPFRGSKPGRSVTLKLQRWDMARKLFMRGDIGHGESYIEGDWECDQINELIALGIDNYDAFKNVIKGSIFKILVSRIKHNIINRNTVKGSRRNIEAHYDLGNDFYKLWLDSTMTYSSAIFANEDESLQEAQERKYASLFNELNYLPGETILEIGCGWGGFLEFAAKRGARITGITISKEQYEYAKARVKPYGDLVEVKLLDYRHVQDQYDHVVSIEMFEALGESYWNMYFKMVNRALKPRGNAVIQTITIRDQDFQSYRKGSDFIQNYIFPGGMLPSVGKFLNHSFRNGFLLAKQKEFGIDYAQTLARWDKKFMSVLPQVKSQGFDEKFIRTWHFYLKYCQGGFEARKISVSQFKLVKEGL